MLGREEAPVPASNRERAGHDRDRPSRRSVSSMSSGGWARTSFAMDCQTRRWDRANLSRDVRARAVLNVSIWNAVPVPIAPADTMSAQPQAWSTNSKGNTAPRSMAAGLGARGAA